MNYAAPIMVCSLMLALGFLLGRHSRQSRVKMIYLRDDSATVLYAIGLDDHGWPTLFHYEGPYVRTQGHDTIFSDAHPGPRCRAAFSHPASRPAADPGPAGAAEVCAPRPGDHGSGGRGRRPRTHPASRP